MRGLKNYLRENCLHSFFYWDHVIHIFQNIYAHFWWYTYLVIIISELSYFGMGILFRKQTSSTKFFFRENKHDLKRFVVYLEVDNMGIGKTFFLCQLDLNCRLTEAMIYFALEFLFLTPIQKRFVWFE